MLRKRLYPRLFFCLLACLLLLSVAMILPARAVLTVELYVDISLGMDDESHGTSAGTGAWKTLHYAIDQINGYGPDPDIYILHVSAGTYSTETGEPDYDLVIGQDNVTVQGAGREATIIGGGGSASVGIVIDASYVTIRNIGVRGFEISGVEIPSGTGNRVRECNIYENATGVDFDSVTGNGVLNCNIYDNSIGIYVYNAHPEIRRNRIYDNHVGIYIYGVGDDASPVIWNNLIYGTTETMDHAIDMYAYYGTVSPEIYHNTMNGGNQNGVTIYQNSEGTVSPEIKYNIISNFEQYGIGNDSGTPSIDYNDVWNNTLANYSGCSAGPNDLSEDPRYGSYELQGDSPCIDAIPTGNPPNDPVDVDLDGNVRPEGPGFDMGCYEYGYSPPTIISYTPTSGGEGTEVTITGTGFTGVSAVSFGATDAASFTMDSPAQITAVVGTGSTGKVSVSTPGGTAVSEDDFTYYGPQIPVAWSIFNAHEADGSLATKILVWILNGFTGTLPDDIDTITVTGPSGVLPYTKDDFVYKAFSNPPWSGLLGRFALTIPGSPALGEYTVNVVSGTSESGIRKDVQTVNRSIPIIDSTTFSPGNGTTVGSKTPSFSWEGIDYSEAAVYYQLQIMDMSDHLVYFSAREKGMVAWTLPVGVLTPGETYEWRVITADDSDYNRIQNRSFTDWFTFTMANTLMHGALPAIDGGSTLGATTWSTNPTNLLFWASVTDHDGVASDGSSHTLTVTFPDGETTVPMSANTMNSRAYLFDEKQIRTGTRVFFWGFVDLQGNPAPPGNYTFTVTDPDGNVGTMVDDLVVSPLDPPDVSTLSPSLAGEQITAYFDNVYVNGLLFDDFDSYEGISDLNPGKWASPPGCAAIESGKVKTTQTDMVGSGNCPLTLKEPGSANSIQADITVSSISSNVAQARVFGFFYNNGNADVLAVLRVRDNQVSYGVYGFLVGDSLTLNSIGGGDLMSVAPGQTVTVSIAWDGTALTFSAVSGELNNAAIFTPAGPVYPVTRFGSKGIGTRIMLSLPNTTPTFSLEPVAGANLYSIRFFDYWDDYVIWNVYGGNTPSLQVPPGLLKPNAYYHCDIRVHDAHDPLDISNYAKAPSQNFEIYTGEQAVDPFIEFDGTGVQTWNDALFGPHLMFWVKVHDAQEVPGNIKSVKVIFPDGSTEETLYYADGNPFDAWNKKTLGCYFTRSYLPIAAGIYTFTVEDQEGHIYSTTEELTPDVIGYPAEASIMPVHNTVIGSTAVNFDWDDVPGVAFYRLEIYDEDFERLYALGTTESQYNLAAGFLKDGTLYRYRIRTNREFYDQNVDNTSDADMQFPWMPTFFTSGVSGGSSQPTIDTVGEGVVVYHYTHPGTGGDFYVLTFNVEVSDDDGVPGNIKKVEVTYPDGATKKTLIFRGNPYRGENGYYSPEFYTDHFQIPVGTYTFTVTDFDDNSAQITDELTVVNPLPLVTNYSPADNSETSTRPLFTWDTVPGAAKYEVCIYNANGNRQLHTSGFLTGPGYLVPAGILTTNTAYSYRIMAYRESDSDVDAENASSSGWQRAHFTTALSLGTISGFVYTEDGSTPVSGATVGVEDFTSGQGMGGATSGTDGSYTITDLPAGQYRVNAWADGRVRNYWKDTLWHHEATAVSVTDGQDTPNITFKLAPGGTISGQVLSANPGEPLAEISVDASRQDGEGGSGATTDENGNYTVTGVPFGQYRVSSPSTGRWGSGDDGYATQYYNGHTGPDSADLVTISSGSPDATGIDFELAKGGTISGHVYKEDGQIAVADLHVYATDHNTGTWMAGTNTGQDGSYSLVLPTGIYRVGTAAQHTGLVYVDEWYDNVPNYNDATPVSVTAPGDTPDINFALIEGGTISGRVTTTGGQPLVNVCVDAVDSKCDGIWRGTKTDANGNYSIVVPAGTFYVQTNPSCDSQSYVTQWWDNGSGTIDCNQAAPVVVTTGKDTPNINFSVGQGATITGTVTSDTDGLPIEGVEICGWPFTGGPWLCANTQSDGTYILTGLQPGYTRVQASGAGYLTEYYDNSYDYNWATAVWVTAGQTTSNINFSMGSYGSISGTVYQSDGTTPLPNVCVGAYMHQCGSNRTASTQADSNGDYTITGLSPGNYYVHTAAACTDPLHYVDEWWTVGGGATVCDRAGAVTVTSEQNTSGINFALSPSEDTYPEPSFRSAGVYASHNADESITTGFYAFINGPSPEDVVSVTVTGPSGTFNLGLAQLVFRQIGNFYWAGSGSVVDNGTYTFVVTDSLGRTATATRDFTYDSTIPQVDSATMTPVNQSYVGTATPTLTWDAVTWPGTQGYYQILVYDYDGQAIWYSETTEGTSVTIPEGYLQPDTPYYWLVRTMDIPATGERGQNRRHSNTLYFYTGAEGLVPDVSQNLPYSYTDPNFSGAIWFGVHNVNLAPWDIDYLRVIGPDGTIYPYNGRNWFGYSSMWYRCHSSGPFPIPDGTYTYEVTDKDSNIYTATMDHTYVFVPTISEDSRAPADNAYLYTKTPTFSWDPPNKTGTFYYSLRIYDYNSRVAWYSSPPITETTFTLPEEFAQKAPFGSYKWQVRVYNGPDYDGTNAAISSSLTFTLNATTATVTTTTPSSITSTTASSGGDVTEDGGASVTTRGVCWSTSANPTTEDSHTSDGTGTGSFTSSITGLNLATTYYVRAYATNSVGTSYGSEESFTTLAELPSATTGSADPVGSASATLNGTVNPNGASTDVIFEYGETTGYGSTETAAQSPLTGTGAQAVSAGLTGLSPGTTYHFRVKATNSIGPTHGSDQTFTTAATIPTLTTTAVSAITFNSALSGGDVTTGGGADVTARGVCWSTSADPTIADSHTSDGTGTGSFTSSITLLSPGTTYHVRAYATNSAGTAYGSDLSFITPAIMPTVTTRTPFSITSTTASSGGDVTEDGGASVTTRGVCWSTSADPTIADSRTSDGTGTGVFTSSITGLSPGTEYHVRAYATNSEGTAYGSDLTFITPAILPTVTTTTPSAITQTSASSGGNVTEDGGVAVTARGVCWSTSANPTTEDSHTSDGTGTGVFTSSITGLNPGTTYHVRAYATNSAGTAYGSEESFTTLSSINPGTFYVNIQNGDDSNDGSSGNPWKTLHYAMDRINGGSAGTYELNVKLASGTHYSTSNGEADKQLIISQDDVTIIGETGSAPVLNGTSAANWTYGIKITGSRATVRNLYITGFSGENKTGIEIIAGLNNTVEDCRIYGNHDGISIWQSDHCTIHSCEIDNNDFDGISINESAGSIITQNTIHDNSGNDSDGIIVQGCSPEISRNTIYDNRFNISVQAYGSEITSPTIKNNLIYEDTSGEVEYGILISSNDSSTVTPKIYHNTIDGGTYDGIIIEKYGSSTINPEIKYNIITNFEDYGILNSGGTPDIDYNDVWNNTSGSYSGCSAGPNGISKDPLYGSYELQIASPCIDAIPTGAPPDDPVTNDLDGTARPQGEGYDMGCYEYVYEPPTILSFTPAYGGSGTAVTITGTNFIRAEVQFGGTDAASFTVDSPTQITAVVGTGSTGKVTVTTPGGTGTSETDFIYYELPALTSFSPTMGGEGTPLTITGSNFTGATSVQFGGTDAASFTVDSPVQITAVVGTGSTGKVTVTTPGGTGTSETDFTYYNTTISGTVKNDTDGQPIKDVQICGWPFPGGPIQCTATQSDGTYTLTGLQPGYTKVQASGADYLTEYYDNSYDPNWATAVWVTADQTTPDIDFSMGHHGSISGTIYQSDGTTPLPNVCVGAYMHQCGSNRTASAQADANGNYTLSGLPPGNYYVHTGAACTQPLHYVDEWWTASGGATVCDQAGAVTVALEQDTPGINFSLNPSQDTYPGPSFRSAGVFSAHNADGSIRTTFYAFINGPSPEDVSSFTVAGPSGTFNLNLNQTPFRQLGNFYAAGSGSVVENGTYTFVVTDSLGRTATLERSFTYDSTVPQVDSNTMKVDGKDNYAYVGTATPTLTWDAVTWPGTPGYYQAFVYDYDGWAIWYTETTEGTSITIPEGYLQPDTPYYWWVRACDIPATGERGQNRHYSNTRYFYTGIKGLPDLTTRSILSYTSPDNGWANWFGISRVNLAPWDIDLYNVTGPEGTVYPYNGRIYLFWHPMYYHCWSPGPAPTPDGTYTFDLEDKDLSTDTQTGDFTYDPASPIPETTRLPADNAYLYTKTPTFSWSVPANSNAANPTVYYYNLRIYDYNSRVHWYSSNTGTETSVTLPDTFNAPAGSYKWEVRTYTHPDGKNAAFSSTRTFTVPPLSQYDYTLPGGTGLPTDYRIFTVPFYMGTGAALLNAMEKELGPYDPAWWRVFSWDGSVYFEIDSEGFESLTIVPSMAFWIISLYTDTIQFEGAPCPDDTYYEIELSPGWNMFALPWPATDIYLGDIAITDGVNNYAITSPDNELTQKNVWDYTGEGPNAGYEEVASASDLLQAGGGFWILVLVDSNVKMLIPPDDSGNYFSVSTIKDIKSFKANMFGKETPPLSPGESTRFLSRRPVQSQVTPRALTSSSHDAPAAVQGVLPPN